MSPQVLVRAVRRGMFVEFEYSLDGGELAVELILPILAFDEFCRDNRCRVACVDTSRAAALYLLRQQPGMRAVALANQEGTSHVP